MSAINERIAQIVESSGLTKTAFAAEINISQPYLSQLCSASGKNPSDRTISDICRKFSIDEVWLRTGEGQPKSKTQEEDKIVAALAEAMGGNASSAQLRLIRAIAKLPPDYFPAVEKLLVALADTLEKPPESSENPPEK